MSEDNDNLAEQAEAIDPIEAAYDRKIEALFAQAESGAGPEESDTPAEDQTTARQPPTGQTADTRADGQWEERYKNAQAKMTQATQEAAQLRQQLAEMQGQIDRLMSHAGGQGASQAPPAMVEGTQADDDFAYLDTASDEFDIAPVVKAFKQLAQEQKLTKAQLQQREQAERERQAAEAGNRHYQAIYAAHPDVEQIIADPAYAQWIQAQPPAVQAIARDGSAADVNWLLDNYKQGANGQPDNRQAQRTQAAKAAAVPNLKGQSPAQRKPDNGGKVPWSTLNQLPMQERVRRMAEMDDKGIDVDYGA